MCSMRGMRMRFGSARPRDLCNCHITTPTAYFLVSTVPETLYSSLNYCMCLDDRFQVSSDLAIHLCV